MLNTTRSLEAVDVEPVDDGGFWPAKVTELTGDIKVILDWRKQIDAARRSERDTELKLDADELADLLRGVEEHLQDYLTHAQEHVRESDAVSVG